MRRLLLFTLLFISMVSIAAADEYFELKPGFVSSSFVEGVGFYTSPSFKNDPVLRIGPGVTMYLDELLDNGWASIRFLSGTTPMEGYVRTGSLVMNDYGLSYDIVRLVSDDLDIPIPFYEEPSDTADIHGYYFTGTLFNFYGVREDGYARVAIGKMVGYIPSKYLFAYNSCTTSNLPIASISNPSDAGSSLTNVAFPETTSALQPATEYPNATEVTILGITPEKMCHVMIDGRTGFIHRSELQMLVSTPHP